MTNKEHGIIWSVLIVLSILLFSRNIQDTPRGKLSLAQADHYSVALGFLDNNFDFFHPQSHTLNPQYPAKTNSNKAFWSSYPKNPKGITSIDFPIIHYTVGILMHLLNTTDPWVFRLTSLIICLLGLYYLFKTAYLINNSFQISIVIVSSVLLAPVYTYHSFGFLPSTAALSFIFIASYFFIRYHISTKISYFILFISFSTLAALIRFPFIIYLIAILSSLFYRKLVSNISLKKEILINLISIVTVLSYFMYNQLYLSEKFGSILLSAPAYATTLQQFSYAIIYTVLNNSWRYGTIFHYLIFIWALVYVFKNSKKTLKKGQIPLIILALSISTLGVLLYSLLMIRQFPIHDYYIFDTYFPVIIFWILLASVTFKENRQYLSNKTTSIIILSLLVLNQVHYFAGYTRAINHPKSPYEKTRINFEKSNITLDSLNIYRNAKILLIDSYCTNLAFIGMNRKGFCVRNASYKTIKRALIWEYDYIITQNFSYKEEVLSNYPNFEKETTVFYRNDKYTIHTKK
jgi:hypothetical protein